MGFYFAMSAYNYYYGLLIAPKFAGSLPSPETDTSLHRIIAHFSYGAEKVTHFFPVSFYMAPLAQTMTYRRYVVAIFECRNTDRIVALFTQQY